VKTVVEIADAVRGGRLKAVDVVDECLRQIARAYKVGMLSIVNARRRLQDALGARFDIRRFHDLVLGQGSMPLALFERHVDSLIGEPASPV
jgi:hypothetical protein